MTSKPHWLIRKQVRIWIAQLHHVGAKSALFRRLFMPTAKKTSSAHSLAPPLQIATAALGCDLGFFSHHPKSYNDTCTIGVSFRVLLFFIVNL